jgi:protein phosphatase PTC7
MASPLRGLALAASRSRPLRIDAIIQAGEPFTLPLPRPQSSSPSHKISSKTPRRHTIRAFHTSPASRSSAKFTYGIAASFSAKDRRYNPDKDVFSFNPYDRVVARRKDKQTRPNSGQDAFFASRIGESNDVAFGVADGVGGWADSGVDAADFSHGICDYMAYAAQTYRPDESSNGPYTARSLMQRGYEDISEDETVPYGGSTACVAIAKADGTLEVANLGDSGFMQLRLNAIHEYSEPQTHGFNAPYQLSVLPKRVLAQMSTYGSVQFRDFPKDANVSHHLLRHGDVLVFATDGVWDNLSSQDILRVVSRMMVSAQAWQHTPEGIQVGPDLQHFIDIDDASGGAEEIPSLQSFLAVGITREAKAASINTKKDGPFAKEVQKRYPFEYWRGGKVDDICVVVAIVVEDGK